MGVCIYRSVYTLMNVEYVSMYVSVHVNCEYVSVHACILYVCFHVCTFWGFIAPFCIPLFTQRTNTNRGITAAESPSGCFDLLLFFFVATGSVQVTSLTRWRHDPSSGESISGMWLHFKASTVPSLIFFFSLNSWSFSSQFSFPSSSAAVP